MPKRVLCKFFAHGACLKGEHCEFAHDWKAPSNNICTFYQKGACTYGSRCRYDHVKVSTSLSATLFSSASCHGSSVADSASFAVPSGTVMGEVDQSSGVALELSASSRPFFPHGKHKAAWNQQPAHPDMPDVGVLCDPASIIPADRALCSFAAAGSCPRGEKCPHIHGDLCPTCGKCCLHPFRPEERDEHTRTCEKRQNQLESLKRSQEIECSVCLERVLTKPVPAERKFGLLSECDHPFCITCIRNWRSNSPSSGMDVNTALRACPICRKLSYFVVPSVIWYSSKEEKQEIVENYKAKLKSIDCKYFDFGNGTCPFGGSCFYKHAVMQGSALWNRALNPHESSDFPRTNNFSDDDSDDMLDFPDAADIDSLTALFEHLCQPQTQMGEENSNLEELLCNDLVEQIALSTTLEELCSDEDGEGLLSSRERSYLQAQLGCGTSCGPSSEEESLSPRERRFLLARMGYDISELDDEDLLTPWERSFLWSQLGYDSSDED